MTGRAAALGVFSSRPFLAALTLLALALTAELVPPLHALRVLRSPPGQAPAESMVAEERADRIGEATLSGETVDRAGPEVARSRARGPIASPTPPDDGPEPADKTTSRLEDPSGRALAGFFTKLAEVEARKPGALARITHFGDSLIASDFVSSNLREAFQKRFGDGGHGFVLIANAWPSYFHQGVSRYATRGWKVSRVVGPYAEDGWYGLGGVAFRAEKHVLARFGTAERGELGRSVSRFVIYYAEEPRGGRFQIRLDGKDLEVIDTSAPEPRARLHEVRAADGPHSLELQTLSGESRLFGVVLERDGPGVVLDAVGIQGARIRFLDKQDDEHWKEQLKFRSSDLLVYEFGANEASDGFLYPMPDYHRTMKEVIAQGQRALPGSSCLIVAAMDAATKRGDEIVSVRVIPHLVTEQRKVAAELGCAFFDTYQAMGGPGSMPAWVRRGLGQADLTHPTGAGAERIAGWLFDALMREYAKFRQR